MSYPNKKIRIFLVGGAVRDSILKKSSNDHDYVVVGATVEDMIKMGFRCIGKSFPVFIKSGEQGEYALARREIKIGKSHTDFKFFFSKDVTLEEDLQRRDFTCNAIAYDNELQQFIDPFGGIGDIKNKVLRVVDTVHFAEDPLRVLRLCRFSAQLDFDVDPLTMQIATKMTADGELENLSAERIWAEIYKALQCRDFYKFLQVANQCGVIQRLFFSQKMSDAEIERFRNLNEFNGFVKISTLLCYVTKSSETIAKQICVSLKMPSIYREFCLFVCKYKSQISINYEINLDDFVDIAEYLIKRPQHFENDFLNACFFFADYDIAKQNFIRKLLRNICSVLRGIKATDMPNFDKLPKDKTFAEQYKQYKISLLKQLVF
ncbi:MAG: multifunctional CCA tRNA nucleotidyl transferase/2'3'-cyclic phosphodiesterase/2'nucleotidase/phosphatase [Alphaproteobacteria bacterium]|nr:multifunctional CCA tRNA nucleotidyl transferase/2'3'-cyclic phosphodiesterase/2'nucleotidase/phosphatase [Alphaproteobacteria bacterium]